MNMLRRVVRAIKERHEWFTGDYASWEEAMQHCTGYDDPAILEKVKESLLKVKRGEAVCERDSVLLDKIEYSMPLLVSLLGKLQNN